MCVIRHPKDLAISRVRSVEPESTMTVSTDQPSGIRCDSIPANRSARKASSLRVRMTMLVNIINSLRSTCRLVEEMPGWGLRSDFVLLLFASSRDLSESELLSQSILECPLPLVFLFSRKNALICSARHSLSTLFRVAVGLSKLALRTVFAYSAPFKLSDRGYSIDRT